MSFSFDCDFNLQGLRLTPIGKRLDVRLGMIESASEPLQSAHENFFNYYLLGDPSAVWDVSTAYSRYDRVNYQNRIYECTNDNTGELPTGTGYWTQVLVDFRGATERIKYNCQKIMLEWILNKWFGATFRQPSSGADSDFYIEDIQRDGETFTAYIDVEPSGLPIASNVFEGSPFTMQWVFEAPIYDHGANFAVYYPVAVIPTTSDDKYFQMVSLINKYKILGSTVEYISY
jgi:hypothetical protein